MSIKINILPGEQALGALLDGAVVKAAEGEATLEIREAIVQGFTRHHLKAIVAQPQFAQATEKLARDLEAIYRETVEAEIGTIKSDAWGRNPTIELKPALANRIQGLAKEAAEKAIAAQVRLFETRIQELAEDAIRRAEVRMQRAIDAGVDELVKQRFAAALAAAGK